MASPPGQGDETSRIDLISPEWLLVMTTRRKESGVSYYVSVTAWTAILSIAACCSPPVGATTVAAQDDTRDGIEAETRRFHRSRRSQWPGHRTTPTLRKTRGRQTQAA